MEARLALVLALVILIRLPFLNQPVQGDDVYYLAIARNVPVDPWHPMHMGFTFQGASVAMAGHPHPPLNAYILALLLRAFGGFREPLFHAAYMMFSVVAVLAMYRLARRFTDRPLLATLLFASVPAFVVNGNSLEADIPFLAFWMAGFALYFEGQHALGAGSLALAALGAYQAIFAAPILAHHTWYRRRRSRTAWLAVFAAPVALAAWQIFQRLSAEEAPAAVLAGYLKTYGLLAVVRKLHSALALIGHLGWTVFPLAVPPSLASIAALPIALFLPSYLWWQRILLAVSLAAGLAILARWIFTLWKERSSEDGLLAAWGLVFFAGAVVVFFAGSARYLLPVAAPAVLTIVRNSSWRWLLWPAIVLNLAVGLALATANYQYSRQYRVFAERLKPLVGDRQIWSGAEWGLRYYLEQIGAEPLVKDQPLYRGSIVVTSELAGKIPITSGGRRRELLKSELRNRLPIRLIGLDSRSGYSSSDLGVLPFDLGRGVIDRVRAETIEIKEPRLSYLRMNDPEAADQLLSGFYPLEDHNAWRWMSEQAAAVLRSPENAARFEMLFAIPEPAPARRVTVALDGVVIASENYSGPGRYTIAAPVEVGPNATPQVVISADKGFYAPGDRRRLGMIVQELGLVDAHPPPSRD